MDSGEIHILRAWGEVPSLAGATHSAILACVERLLTRDNPADRVLLIANEHGERSAAALGLCTPLIVPPAAVRMPGVRDGLRRLLARFERPARLIGWDDELRDRVRSLAASAWDSPVIAEDGRISDALPRRVPSGDRDSIRASLGLPVTEHVLILASDPPDALSAHDFIRACALVALVGRDVTAIVPRQAPEMERAKATLRNTGIPMKLLTCEAPIWTMLPCADAVVVDVLEGSMPRSTPAHSKRWLAATCAGLGIPVVWSETERFGIDRVDRWVLQSRSRLAVHVARAINEHLLATGGETLVPTSARREVIA